MKTANLYEAKTHLSALVAEALAGEEVVLARNGVPVVRLTPVKKWSFADALGMDAGRIFIAEDFDATPADFEEYT